MQLYTILKHLSQDPVKGVVISFAMLSFDESRFIDKPYSYEELLKNCRMIKFLVDEQVKEYGQVSSTKHY